MTNKTDKTPRLDGVKLTFRKGSTQKQRRAFLDRYGLEAPEGKVPNTTRTKPKTEEPKP